MIFRTDKREKVNYFFSPVFFFIFLNLLAHFFICSFSKVPPQASFIRLVIFVSFFINNFPVFYKSFFNFFSELIFSFVMKINGLFFSDFIMYSFYSGLMNWALLKVGTTSTFALWLGKTWLTIFWASFSCSPIQKLRSRAGSSPLPLPSL